MTLTDAGRIRVRSLADALEAFIAKELGPVLEGDKTLTTYEVRLDMPARLLYNEVKTPDTAKVTICLNFFLPTDGIDL